MNHSHNPQVIFLRVTDNTTKLQRLCAVVHDHFYHKENVLIAVPNAEAAVYIDHLLWRMPEDSFTPHVIAEGLVKERVAITTSSANINQATTFVNLCADVPVNAKDFHIIYDLLDLTHPAKEELSRKRQAAYRTAGYHIEET